MFGQNIARPNLDGFSAQIWAWKGQASQNVGDTPTVCLDLLNCYAVAIATHPVRGTCV